MKTPSRYLCDRDIISHLYKCDIISNLYLYDRDYNIVLYQVYIKRMIPGSENVRLV